MSFVCLESMETSLDLSIWMVHHGLNPMRVTTGGLYTKPPKSWGILGMDQEWTRNNKTTNFQWIFLVHSWFIPGPFLVHSQSIPVFLTQSPGMAGIFHRNPLGMSWTSPGHSLLLLINNKNKELKHSYNTSQKSNNWVIRLCWWPGAASNRILHFVQSTGWACHSHCFKI